LAAAVALALGAKLIESLNKADTLLAVISGIFS
jgi:hypothetical protein